MDIAELVDTARLAASYWPQVLVFGSYIFMGAALSQWIILRGVNTYLASKSSQFQTLDDALAALPSEMLTLGIANHEIELRSSPLCGAYCNTYERRKHIVTLGRDAMNLAVLRHELQHASGDHNCNPTFGYYFLIGEQRATMHALKMHIRDRWTSKC